jgi:kumamolisin
MPARVELANSAHRIPPGAKAMRKTNPNAWLEVTLGVVRKADLPDLSKLEALKPADRTYLTHKQLAKGYGSDEGAVERINAFAQAHKLEVLRDDPISARMTLGGTVADMSAAFGVTLFDYQDPDLGDFHARTGNVSLPPEIAKDVTGVFGFSNQRHLRRKRRKITFADPTTAAAPAKRAWFYPTELVGVYDFPDSDASGQCIALLEFGGGFQKSDFDAYFAKLGVAKPKLEVVALDGVKVDPDSDQNSTGEVMLDIDVAGAMAPGAEIVVYFSTFDEKGLIDAISAVISDTKRKPSVVSISWGWDENQKFNQDIIWSPAAIDHVNHSFLAAAHLGITICVSTGDDGSEAQMHDGRAHVNFPATSPYALAVGGTTLQVRQTAAGGHAVRETVWNDGAQGGGTGGGISDYTPRPDWQSGIKQASVNPGGFVGRGIPDVAANADPNTGYMVMSNGQFGVVGGTSASAPLWAALIARINTALKARAGNFNALLYQTYGPAKVLHDITAGDNDTQGLLGGQYKAEVGWDPCTGWGSPRGKALLKAMS